MNAITVTNVSKHFTFKTHKGIKGFLNPERKVVKAVDDIIRDEKVELSDLVENGTLGGYGVLLKANR